MSPLNERVVLPRSLQGVFFDFVWEVRKAWMLPTEPSVAPFDQLAWLLDLPVWTTVPGEARFDLTPRTVLDRPEQFPIRWQRILAVDLMYPLDMFRNDQGCWVILDGYHRLARHQVERSCEVPVRFHPDEYKGRILP